MGLWPTKKCFVYIVLDIMIMIKRDKGTRNRQPQPRKYPVTEMGMSPHATPFTWYQAELNMGNLQ